ncbi:MAG: helix-turn-helix domain-containing protein [Melioribacteraceae bacterium]|nr:helix-turn-helix domain-containing protein [Melioribacteraceae bacterium]
MKYQRQIKILFYICGFFLKLSDPLSSQVGYNALHIPYTSNKIIIDGNLSDWDTSLKYYFKDTLTSFVSTGDYELKELYPPQFDFLQIKNPKSKNEILFQACWNLSSIYFAFTVWDKHLVAEIESRIDKPRIHMNDGIEIYIDTKNDSPAKMDINDYQFIVDIKGETIVFRGDRKEIIADTTAVPKDYDQNVLFQLSTNYIGTINDETVEDSLYIIEIAIPFAAIGLVPKSGDKFKLDICINDVDYFRNSGVEIEEISTNIWSFNWSGYSDFGYPNYWKLAELTGNPTMLESFSEKYKKEWLWIYITTLLLVIIVIALLLYRIYKIRQIPSHEEINKSSILFFDKNLDDNILSYNQKILKSISNFIVEKRNEAIHSEDAARVAGISLRTFQRITREELNLTPTNYIYVIKLKLVAEYLKNKEGNITDATYEFGFSDPSYFSKIFKKYYGISPTDFVKNIANH